MADNRGSASESEQFGQAALVPVPPPNSQSGEAPPLIGPITSLISDSSGSAPPYFFVGVRERFQASTGLSVCIDEPTGSMSSFFGGDEREVRGDEDLSEASEGSGYRSGFEGVSEGSCGCRG